MQTKNNNLNKIFMGTVLASSAVICSAAGLALKPVSKAHASSAPTNINIDNSSFTSGDSKPYNWQSISNVNSNVVASIVNTSSEGFEDNKKNYKISVNPGKAISASASDNNVFMLNSENIAVSYGYKSNNFTLASNGYYIIEVPVKTQNEGWASVYLVDESNDFELKCENIQSKSSYTTYTFYVATNSTELNVNLQLYLGSKANVSKNAVFFDEIKATSYSESSFYTLYNERNANSDSSVPAYTSYSWAAEDNSKFTALSEDGSNPNSEGFVQKVYSLASGTSYPEHVSNPTNGNLINNDYALLLKNQSEASVGVRYNTSLNIKSYDYILYSFYIKTNTSNGGLTIKLVEKNDDNEYVEIGDAISNVTTSNNDKLNGWEKVSFAIKASAVEDKEVFTEFWLGNSSTKASGYAFIGKRTVESITSDEYSDLSTSSKLVTIRLDSVSEDSTSFKNHSFNDFEKVSNNNSAFVKPANLEKIDSLNNNYGSWNGSDNFASGIVNTNSAKFNANNYPFANPGKTPNQHSDLAVQTNNVLAIYQNSPTYQGYKTSTANLNSNSYYKLTIYVKTQVYSNLSNGIDNVNGGARWALTYKNVVISEFNNVVANNEWTTLTTYIQTGLDNMEVTAELSLGNANLSCNGTAFFDDMMISSSTEDEFNAAVSGNYVNTVSLKNDGFNLVSENRNGYGLYESKNWTSNASENCVSGVLNTSNIPAEYGIISPSVPENSKSTNVLYINNQVDLATSYKNTFTQKLSSNSYYKISVWAKTYNLSQSETNTSYKDEEKTEAIPYGAFITINNVEEKFEAITNTDWKQYIFYVNSDTDINLTLNLGLGSDNALTSGYAYFANVEVSSMEEADFTSATAAYENGEMPSNVKMVKTAIKETEGDDNSSANQPNEWTEYGYLIIPSLITGLAIVIAIIGTILRGINFSKFVKLKKKSNNYDRKKVQIKSVRRAEIENIVKEKLDELNRKLKELESNKEVQEQHLLNAKEKYLSLKEIKKPSKEQKVKLNTAKNEYYNVYNALSNTIVDINIIKDDIVKIKSDKYILKEEYALMLKQWREDKKAMKIEKRNKKAKEKFKK